ncbi:MAG: hypothetical protein ABI175_01200 [Polyangiales bacterium]
MIRSLLVVSLLISAASCGDNEKPLFDYSNPPKGGMLRLIKSKTKPASQSQVVLDLVVGDQPLTGYSVGFNLPLPPGTVRLADFVPGKVLDPGTSPPAAQAIQPTKGPLAGHLVTALSQKASGPGAVATDTLLPAGTVLYTIRLEVVGSTPDGIVVDGTAADFVLPSGGMRDHGGTTVVEAKDVSIGTLEVNR